MAEHRTDLIVSAKPEGFRELQQQVLGIQEKSNQANRTIIEQLEKAKRAAEQTSRPEQSTDALAKLVKAQQALSDTMLKSTDKAGKEYENLTGVIGNLESAFSNVTDQILKMNRAREEQGKRSKEERDEARAAAEARRKERTEAREAAAEARREEQISGAFTQGFIQSVGGWPAAFLQRGPGMGRQMGGMVAGGAIRRGIGAAGGLAASPFTGVQGLQQGLATLPFGGIAAGMLGSIAGWGEQALGFEQQKVGMMPFFGGANYLGRVSSAARDVPSEESIRSYAGDIADKVTGRIVDLNARAGKDVSEGALDVIREDVSGRVSKAPMAGRRRALRRLAEERNRPFAGITGAGARLGYGAQESLQFAQQILASGGGGGEDLAASGLGTGGMAFQRAYGLQAPTIGAFQMAGRRGGMAGGEGGSAALISTVASGFKLGLVGSELIELTQMVASGIESFKTTGIPFARKSIEEMGGALARGGIAGPRGIRMAGAITSAAQNLSATGIQSPFQLAMMKHLGGFEGGGFEGAFDAMVRMESGDIAEGGMKSLFRERMKMGGGGKRGAAFLSAELQSIGVRLPFGSAAMMGRVDEEKTTTDDLKELAKIQKQITGVAGGAPGSMEDVETRARGFVGAAGPNLKTQVALQNKQLEIGERMLPMLKKLETSTTKSADQFARMAAGPLESFADGIVAASVGIKKFVDIMKGGPMSISDILGLGGT